jgi:hypothetical protein
LILAIIGVTYIGVGVIYKGDRRNTGIFIGADVPSGALIHETIASTWLAGFIARTIVNTN